MPRVAKGNRAFPLSLEEYQYAYLKALAESGTNMGASPTAIAEFLLRREVQRLIESDHLNRDWR